MCRFWRLAKIPILPDDYSKETSRLIELGKKVHKACEILVSVWLLHQTIPCVKSGWSLRERKKFSRKRNRKMRGVTKILIPRLELLSKARCMLRVSELFFHQAIQDHFYIN